MTIKRKIWLNIGDKWTPGLVFGENCGCSRPGRRLVNWCGVKVPLWFGVYIGWRFMKTSKIGYLETHIRLGN